MSAPDEFEQIARLWRPLTRGAPEAFDLLDDAAALPARPGFDLVITKDAVVEGVHFRRDWSTAESIGHKALAVNLSDLAAMGATPRASLLSLALPTDFPLADFDALLDGYLALSASSGTALVGGNLTRSPGPLIVDVTAIGSVGHRHVLTRTGARKGDELYVTGAIGAAAAGLAMRQAGRTRDGLDDAVRACIGEFDWTPLDMMKLSSLAVPALVVLGTRDRVVRHAAAAAARLHGARVLELDGGHCVHEEHPSEVYGAILDFISNDGPAERPV